MKRTRRRRSFVKERVRPMSNLHALGIRPTSIRWSVGIRRTSIINCRISTAGPQQHCVFCVGVMCAGTVGSVYTDVFPSPRFYCFSGLSVMDSKYDHEVKVNLQRLQRALAYLREATVILPAAVLMSFAITSGGIRRTKR